MGECRKYYNVSSLQENYIQDYTVLKNLCRVTGEPFTDPLFNPDDPNIDLIGDIDLLSQGVGQWDGKFIWKRPRVSFDMLFINGYIYSYKKDFWFSAAF